MKDLIVVQLERALVARGYRHDPKNRSPKRIILRHPDDPERNIYLGKRGSCRIGRTIASSIPISPALRRNLLEVK